MAKLMSRQDAAALGKTRYYTGVPCTRGHYSIRITSTGACVECGKEYRTTEKHKEYMRDYNKRIRESLKRNQAEA